MASISPTRPTASEPIDGSLRARADLFLGALFDAPLSERPAMLDALRASDPALHALVESLSVHLDELDDFLEEPIRVGQHEDDGTGFIGTRFGRWNVVRPIGRGGMGLVFEVERADGVVRQRAALKLIKRSLDDRSIIARFNTERQILAQLDHPSIGRLIDAGASQQGRPYLVMEYIDGVPLDDWCDEQALDVDRRIVLFNEICAAVHYAHQHLVVHRDLKPSNILVTADGTPKLLDFGISKLIESDGSSAASAETIDASALLTPRYASPEQLTGAPISTASDVYSLGVLLFELLTGSTPYRTRNDSLVEMMRAVMHEEPSQPSLAVTRSKKFIATGRETAAASKASEQLEQGLLDAKDDDGTNGDGTGDDVRRRLARRLRGDLDHILLKALAKNPAERYESVAALRDDIVRHLAHEPISAAPPSWSYRATKFVRKHRSAVSFAAILALAIVGLSAVAVREAYRADRAREVAEANRVIAEKRFEETRSLAKAMLFELDDAIATGPTKAREQLVRTALTYLDRLSQDRLSPDLERDVAEGYERISDILGNQGSDNLGRSAEARQYLQKALDIRRRLAASAPDDLQNVAGLIGVNDKLGFMARYAGAPLEAAQYFADATKAATRQVELKPDDTKAMLTLFGRRRTEAMVRFSPGRPSLHRFDEAVRGLQSLVADMDSYAKTHPPTPRLAFVTEVIVSDLAGLQRLNGDAAGALRSAQRSLALCEAAQLAHPDDPGAKRDLAIAQRRVGDSLLELGRVDEGMAMLQRSMKLREALFAADPTNARADRDLAIGHSMIGYAYDLGGHPREALPEYEAWAKQADAALKREPVNIGHQLDLAQAYWSIAEQHLALGQDALALSEARQVEADVLAFDEKTQREDAAHEALGKARLVSARVLGHRGSTAAAFALGTEGLKDLEENERQTPEDAFAARDADRARMQAGLIGYVDIKTRAEACQLIGAGRDGLHDLDEHKRLTAQFTSVLDQANAAAATCSRTK
jgi:serine/threonine protein kinase